MASAVFRLEPVTTKAGRDKLALYKNQRRVSDITIYDDESELTARDIVRAVNSHDALLAVAKACAEHFEGTDAPLGAAARAAIAAAEGTQ